MKKALLGGLLLLFLVVSSGCSSKAGNVGFAQGARQTLKDIAYDDDHATQKLDVYLAKSEEPAPAIVYFHGGGWQKGSKKRIPRFLLRAHAEGWLTVVSVEYRFIDVAVHPAQIDDCARAIQFVRHNAKKWNIDPKRIGVVGSSAGAHLAAYIALQDDEANPISEDPVARQSSRVLFAIPFAGPTDWGLLNQIEHKNSAYKQLIGYKPGTPTSEMASERIKDVSPLSFVSADDPPMLIVHGDADSVVPIEHAQVLETALKKAGVPVELYVVKGGTHRVAGAFGKAGVRAYAYMRKRLAVPREPRPLLFQLDQRTPMSSGPLAVGVADLNSDGNLDLVLPSGWESGKFAIGLNQSDKNSKERFKIKFLAMSDDQAHKFTRRITKGLGLHDFDNDGRMDIYLGNMNIGIYSFDSEKKKIQTERSFASSINSVQLNRGNGLFETRDLGINSRGGTIRSVVFSDFDSDGAFDSYHSISPYYGPGWGNGSPFGNELHPGASQWDQYGDNIIQEVLPNPSFWQDKYGRGIKMFKSTLIRDLDNDGHPDIVTGVYADIWNGRKSGLLKPEDAKADLNKDGIDDIIWPGYWMRGLFLLRNVSKPGKIRFHDVSNNAVENANSDGSKYPQMHVYSILAADIDHDADLDLLVTGPRNLSAHSSVQDNTPTVRLLRNNSKPGQMAFSDITKTSGFDFLNSKRIPGYGSKSFAVPNLAAGVMIDYDNDSHVDFVLVDRRDGSPNAQLHPWIFHNDGHGHFRLVPPKEHGLSGSFTDLSYGDFNNDGRQDIVFVNGDYRGEGYMSVYQNTTSNNNHWIKLKVSWPENKFGLESKVTVYKHNTNEILGYDEMRTDFCYRSKRAAIVHFGLGNVDKVDVRVVTRDGIKVLFEALSTDKKHLLELHGSL